MSLPSPRCLATVVAAVALTATLPSAASASVSLRGAPIRTTEVCGKAAQVARTAIGTPVTAVASSKRSKRMLLDRCQDGTWQRYKRLKYMKRGSRRALPPVAEHGDFRLRAAGGRAAYVRVGQGEIVDVPVSFRVENVNRSKVPCLDQPSGGTVVIRGHLTGPRSSLLERGNPAGPQQDSDQVGNAATLYYHGLGYGEFFWRYKDKPGYDYGAEMAKRGHVSVTVDRLGYGASTGPDGMRICYGSQATIAKQIIDQLKQGAYTAERGPKPPRFHRVALAGHSAGGFIAEMTAYSFADVDALIVMGYSDTLVTPATLTALTDSAGRCVAKPERQNGTSGPGHYVRFGPTDADFTAGHIYDMDPEIKAKLLSIRSRDPCGDILSIPPSFVFNQLSVQSMNVPILQLVGANDALFGVAGQTGVNLQQLRYVASVDQEGHSVPGTGHAMTLGRSAPKVRAMLDQWLTKRRF